MTVASMKVRFGTGDDPDNATCDKCSHPISRHGVNAYNDDGKIHCWDCIGVGQTECLTKPQVSAKRKKILP